jgi:hypothetical protein
METRENVAGRSWLRGYFGATHKSIGGSYIKAPLDVGQLSIESVCWSCLSWRSRPSVLREPIDLYRR